MIKINANKARELSNKKEEIFQQTLDIIRQMCDSNITDACIQGCGSTKFTVPVSVFGRDSYDLHKMTIELAKQMYHDGYNVVGKKNYLTIIWNDNKDVYNDNKKIKKFYNLI